MTNTILCPTRGGEASYANQERAIALAVEREAELIFLYVSNVHFLDLTAAPYERRWRVEWNREAGAVLELPQVVDRSRATSNQQHEVGTA